MSELTVHLLGQFQVMLNGKAVTNFASDKVRALLAYLVTESKHPNRREKLAALFWPDKPETTARANLRRALADLRQLIHDQETNPLYLLITRQDIQFNVDSNTLVDCQLLDQYTAQGCANQTDMDKCRTILDLYQGEFMAGFNLSGSIPFDEWMLMMREQYNRKIINLLEEIIIYHEEHQEYNAALPFCWRLVELVPWQESARRQLIRLLTLTGNRGEALQQFDDLVTTLDAELGIEPEIATVHLIEQIKSGQLVNEQPSFEKVSESYIPEVLFKDTETHFQPLETFVARKEALAKLHKKLDTILDSQNGSVHFITGEAGSGKTWLGREFIMQAQTKHPSLVVAAGFCNAYTGIGDPYLPFREIFSQLCGEFHVQLRARLITREYALRLWKISSIVGKALLDYGRGLIETIVPGHTLLDDATFQQWKNQNWYLELKTFVQKQQKMGTSVQFPILFSQVATVLQKVAESSPLILMIDDLQWADTGTINLLMHLGKHLAGSRIMILGAFRSEEVLYSHHEQMHPISPMLNEFLRIYGEIYTRLDDSLGEEFVREFLDSEPHTFSQRFYQHIYTITGGQALFVSELLRSFQENDILIKDGQGRWIESDDHAFEQIPPRIEGVLAQRIQRLPARAQQYLTIASVEGESFTAEVISQITGEQGAAVLQTLNNTVARAHRLIRPQQALQMEDRNLSSFRFRHFLYQKYLYDRIDPIERKQLHEQVGTALETLIKDHKDEYAVQLARHFHEAELFEKAICYYLLGGDRAKRMVGYKEAIHLYETALKLNQLIPESTKKDQQELMLQMQIGLSYQTILGFGHENVGKAYERAWELCQSLEADEHRLNILAVLSSFTSYRADYERTYQIIAQEEKIASTMEETPLYMVTRIHWGHGLLDMRFGRFTSSNQHFQIAIKAYDENQHSASQSVGMEAGIFCHGWASLVCSILGIFSDAQDHIDAIFKIIKGSDNKLYLANALMFSIWGYIYLQDYTKAETHLKELLRISAEEFYLFFEAMGRFFHGILLTQQKQYQQAIDELKLSLQQIMLTGAVAAVETWHVQLAGTYEKAGQLEEARKHLKLGLDCERDTGERCFLAEYLRIQGNLEFHAGNFSQAEESYLEAIATAREQSAKLFELNAMADLAFIMDTGDPGCLERQR